MSGKSAKKRRREIRKFNKEVFKDFTIEVSVMPFFKRLWFCLVMAFNSHAMQRSLKPEIQARRLYDVNGNPVKWYNRHVCDVFKKLEG